MTEAFICDAIRTPISRFGGSLARVRPDDLAAHVKRAIIKVRVTTTFETQANLRMALEGQ
jgi:acetyl-CoA acetyltransferase